MRRKVVAAILMCERKAHQQLIALPAVAKMHGIDRIYLNVEEFSLGLSAFWPMTNWLNKYEAEPNSLPVDIDWWTIESSWRKIPEYDQHQVRLAPIVTARNMAIDYALSHQATHLLFIDSDVIPEPDGLEKLLSLDKSLCGGLVPGRGAHSNVKYIFPGKVGIFDGGNEKFPAPENAIVCGHGTCGYMLIRRNVFGRLRFRWGDDPEVPGQMLSEDPAYCEDWFRISDEPFYIHKEATAQHIDDPANPLTEEGAAKDVWDKVLP